MAISSNMTTNTLERFFWQVYLNREWEERAVPIMVIDNVLIINFNCFFDRDYSLSGVDQLLYKVHALGSGKRFIFMFEDGINPFLSGSVEIVRSLVKLFNLNKATGLIFARDEIDIPEIKLIIEDSIRKWINVLHPVIKDIPLHSGPFDKKFAIWFNRGTFYRLKIARLLKTNFNDDSFISYQQYGMLHDYRYARYFEDDIAWANDNTPIIFDQIFSEGRYDHEMIVGSSRKPYDRYFMEIVVETDCISNTWITEKTVKNLYIGKPFLLMSGAYSLMRMQELGFKTFGNWFDESYDKVENNYQRFELIKQEINRIGAMRLDEINTMFNEMTPVLMHNRQLYSELNQHGYIINSR